VLLARFTVGPFAENCYVVGSPPEVAVVDPGAEGERIVAAIEGQGWRPVAILLTHGHLDHIAHCAQLCERFGVGVWAPREDLFLLESPQMPELGAMLGARPCPAPERFWEDGETAAVAGLELTVIHTPGHTPGGVCLLHEPSRSILVGDTLFHRGIGRTDLPGGDYATLERSIRRRLFTLDGDYTLYPGHGPETSLEDERRSNPFFGESADPGWR
jgi:glyoxylase-like metal-dependent hydrolase (beta-lactamase superfamily II)